MPEKLVIWWVKIEWMTNKEKSAERLSEIAEVLRCPFCHTSMKVMNLKSLICLNNHTFDFAKQGYVNMMTRPANSHYDKKIWSKTRHNCIEALEQFIRGYDGTVLLVSHDRTFARRVADDVCVLEDMKLKLRN